MKSFNIFIQERLKLNADSKIKQGPVGYKEFAKELLRIKTAFGEYEDIPFDNNGLMKMEVSKAYKSDLSIRFILSKLKDSLNKKLTHYYILFIEPVKYKNDDDYISIWMGNMDSDGMTPHQMNYVNFPYNPTNRDVGRGRACFKIKDFNGFMKVFKPLLNVLYYKKKPQECLDEFEDCNDLWMRTGCFIR